MKKAALGVLIVSASYFCTAMPFGNGLTMVHAQSTEEEKGQETQEQTPVPSEQGTEFGQGMPEGEESQPGQGAEQGPDASQDKPIQQENQ